MTTQQPPGIGKNVQVLGAIAALVIVGISGGFWLNERSQQKQAEREEAARPLPKQVKVAALGRVEPLGGVIEIDPREEGVIEEILVKQGDLVTQGQILAYLELHQLRLAERNLAKAQLLEAQETLEAQRQLGDARIQEASTRLTQIDLPQAESMRSQEAAIRELEAQLDLAKADLTRFQQLAMQGAIALQRLDSQVAEVAQAEHQLTAAHATLAQLKSARDANLENANSQVLGAEADLKVSQATAGVKSAESNLALAEARLERTIITSPIDGTIIDVSLDPGSSAGSFQGEPVFLLGNLQEMQIVTEVYETDIGLVDIGQSAIITSRNGAFAQTLTGTVSNIALQIFKNDVLDDDPAANADARVVEVDIRVDQPEIIRSLTNLQVDVVIDVESEAP